MASRFFVWLFKIGEDYAPGKTVVIKRASDNAIMAMTGTGHGYLEIIDNGDGLYYVDGLSSDTYDVYVDGVIQTEMEGYFFAADNIKAHMDDDTIHFEINDAETGANVVLSAAKVYALVGDRLHKDALDDNSVSETGLFSSSKITSLVGDRASATPGTGLKAESEQKLAIDYDGNYFEISGGKLTLKSSVLESVNNRRTIFADQSTTTGTGDASSLPTYNSGEPGDKTKIRVMMNKRAGDTKVRLACKAAVTEDPGNIKLKIPDYALETALTVSNSGFNQKNMELSLPVDMPDGLYEVDVVLNIEMAAITTISITHVTLEVF